MAQQELVDDEAEYVFVFGRRLRRPAFPAPPSPRSQAEVDAGRFLGSLSCLKSSNILGLGCPYMCVYIYIFVYLFIYLAFRKLQ